MNLFEKLKQFKQIKPDAAFSEKSKRMIFATAPAASPVLISRSNTIRTLLRILETGAAVVLTGFFVLLITGGFAGSKLSPAKFSAIDPQSLHAEAQAIDIQIQLAHVNYTENAAQSTEPSAVTNDLVAETSSAISLATSTPAMVTAATSTTSAAATTSATSSPSSSISIDQALLELSK